MTHKTGLAFNCLNCNKKVMPKWRGGNRRTKFCSNKCSKKYHAIKEALKIQGKRKKEKADYGVKIADAEVLIAAKEIMSPYFAWRF